MNWLSRKFRVLGAVLTNWNGWGEMSGGGGEVHCVGLGLVECLFHASWSVPMIDNVSARLPENSNLTPSITVTPLL